MNETIKSIKNRKSVRVYAQKDIGDMEKKAIIDAALQAPTAGNMTLYSIIDITDQELKDRLSVTCDNQPFIAKAPLVLVFCADFNRWMQIFEKYCDDVRKVSYGDFMLSTVDAVIAAQNAVVAAESLGIGSCYIGDITENYEIHKELLNLPDWVVPACMVCFGYPSEQQIARQKPPRFEAEDVVFNNRYEDKGPDKMQEMLMKRQNLSPDEIKDYVVKFCNRKHQSDFSIEMSRSCKAMIDDFCKE